MGLKRLVENKLALHWSLEEIKFSAEYQSFTKLANHSARLLSCFASGLKDYEKFRAPKFLAPLMSYPDFEIK